MAQPQGLNVPVIILTGVVGAILIATVVEGVRAYYFFTLSQEESAKWAQAATPLIAEVKAAQEHTIKFEGKTPIDLAMKQIVASKGVLPVAAVGGPATKPSKP